MFDEATVYLEKASSQIRNWCVFSTHVSSWKYGISFVRERDRNVENVCEDWPPAKRIRHESLSLLHDRSIGINYSFQTFPQSLISFIPAAASLYLLYIEIMFKHR